MGAHEIFLDNKFKQVSKLIPKGSKVLDIGCNNGKLRNFLDNCDYYGVDVDIELIKGLTKKGIKAKKADLNKDEIPFKSQKFDYILLLDIIEHVIDSKELLNQVKKRLNTKGKVIVTLPNDYHILNKIRFVFNKHLTEDPFTPYGHLHFFPIKSGERFLLQNNFKILKKILLPPIKPLIIPQFIKNLLARLFPQSFARDILYMLSSS